MQDLVSIQEGDAAPLKLGYDDAIEKIKIDQQIYMIAPRLKALDSGRNIEMHCYDYSNKGSQNIPRYTLVVTDSEDSKLIMKNTCAAFIVPQGQENATMFCTEDGRQKLISQINTSRVIFVFLGNGHTFDSLKSVQDELSGKFIELAPQFCPPIAVLSSGTDIGQSEVIDVKNEDKVEGIILQDVVLPAKENEPREISRQVIFESKPDQIQSEVQIVYRDPKKNDIKDNLKVTTQVVPKKKGKVAVLNLDYLTSGYQCAMLAGLFMSSNLASNSKLDILHLGTGAGTLPMFLHSQLGQVINKLTTVDINPDIV